MNPRTISEAGLMTHLDQWLNPEKSTIMLCRNVVDIMRLRIFFHEKLNAKKKTFFNIQFLTIDQWLKKIIPGFENSNNILMHPLTLKVYLMSILEDLEPDFKNSVLSDLIELPGFKNELPFLWYVYCWGKKTGISTDNPGTRDSLHDSLLHLFHRVERFLEKSGFEIFQNLLDPSTKVWLPQNHQVDQVICLYPSRFNLVESVKKEFLMNLHPCVWRYIFHHHESESTLNAILKNFLKPKRSFEIYVTARDNPPRISFDEWRHQNRYFFNKASEIREKKIWMGRTGADEHALLAASARTLCDIGVEPHRIFILYTSKMDVPLLEAAFRKQNLRINHPEKTNARNRPVIALVLDLVDLSGVKKGKTIFSRNRLIDLVQNPVLRIPGIDGDHTIIPELVNYIYETFTLSDPILPQEVKSISLSDSHRCRGLNHIADTLLQDIQSLERKKTAGEKFAIFKSIIGNYLHPEIHGDPVCKEQLTEIEKLLHEFSNLENKLQKEFNPGFLFRIFYDELSGLQLPYNNHSLIQDDFPEIYARPVKEGIHSPVEYLFICGLTSRNFPVTEDHLMFLYPDNSPNQALLQLSSGEQLLKIRESFSMVERGIALTFNLEKDSAPSDLIFDEIKSCGQSPTGKKDIISGIPVYSRNQEPDCIPGLKTGSMLKTNSHMTQTAESFHSKFFYFPSKKYRDFTGYSEPGTGNNISSTGHIENLAACPQMFWYKKILRIRKSFNYNESRFADSLAKGTMFHLFAGNLLEYLIQNYPRLQYSKIRSSISEYDTDKIFENASGKTLDVFSKSNTMDYEAVSGEILKNFCKDFSGYFKKFFYAAEREDHPFFNRYPVAVEKPFENINFGPYVFQGRMDRIDYCPSEKLLCVVDYKTARSGEYRCSENEIRNLSRFQLPLYLSALSRSVFPDIPAGEGKILKLQGAYEMIRNSARFPEIYFMEPEEGKISYNPDEIFNLLESLTKSGFDVIREISETGYYFAMGHKKNLDPEETWEPPCTYCDYQKICDNMPYEAMLKRNLSDPLGKKYFEAMQPRRDKPES